jgi:hypothetical protein
MKLVMRAQGKFGATCHGVIRIALHAHHGPAQKKGIGYAFATEQDWRAPSGLKQVGRR